jgi:formamidopyrimidine-DNA glycosylase
MPELPEVETVRRGLQHLVTGYTIQNAQQLHPRALKAESIAPLHALNGAKITCRLWARR